MTPATLKTQSPLYGFAEAKATYIHPISTTVESEKKILLLGNFLKKDNEKLGSLGFSIYPAIISDDAINSGVLKRFSYKEVSCIIIKRSNSKVYTKCIETIKRLKLNESLPILLYSEETLSEKELSIANIIDEIIYDFDNKSSLDFKIDFLTKYKKLSSVRFTLPEKLNALRKGYSTSVRRGVDILIASVLLLILLPIMLIIALFIKLESKGPIFYASKRAGKHYKIFSCIKFRTMEVDADKKLSELSHLNQYNGAGGAQFIKFKNDPRVTKIGSFLRNTSLDELPQLINVIRGDMSLVGNRPLPLYEAATLTIDAHAKRFNAPAGITGLWQVMKRGEEDMSTEERIDLDIKYARNNSLFVDVWILVKTPFAMLQKSDV